MFGYRHKTNPNQRIAVKIIPFKLKNMVKNVIPEAQLCKDFHSKYLVKVYDSQVRSINKDFAAGIVAMDYCDGGTLYDLEQNMKERYIEEEVCLFRQTELKIPSIFSTILIHLFLFYCLCSLFFNRKFY